FNSDIVFKHFLRIKQYKAEVQRHWASEAEIKVLSVNYAVLLKEKEEDSCKFSHDLTPLTKV
ncbi:hypothetical protein FRX31_009568, partial [Thalictrum thalictroides]